MDTHERLIDLIGLVYETVERPERWSSFLEGFADSVSGDGTSLLLYAPGTREGQMSATVRLDPDALRAYNEHYVKIDPWGVHGGHLCKPGLVLTGQELCPDTILKQSEFFNDFCRPINAFHQFCGIIGRSGSQLSMLASSRSRASGPFDVSETRFMQALLPHLQQAHALHQRLGQVSAENRWRGEQLNRLNFGVALLSASAKVLWMNERAQVLIASNDGLVCRPDGIASLRQTETKQLHLQIKDAADVIQGCGHRSGGAILISRPSRRRPFRLLVSPVRMTDPWSRTPIPTVSVFIFDTDSDVPNIEAELSRICGFTRGEARLAASLMGGLTLSEAAQQLGISSNTAKTVLKSLFTKTDTNRQAALVRELLLGPIQVMGR